ncbi:MAG: ethanolamine ammonia-lyase subunit EutC [Bdellovibrionales bacterium]|nr:ethanolamine ammonia-lyase subunit EutC [Bdellovibrionales bacterium]
MNERTKDLLRRRPYLASWFEEKTDERVEPQLLARKTEHLDPSLIKKLVEHTPSRIAVGRAGTRFLTKDSLAMRAGHAIAKDAVYSDISQEFVDSLECIQLHSQNTDREDYLLYPNKGRRLNDESLAKLRAEGSDGVDVQIIVGDGLSAWASERNVPELLRVLVGELDRAGLSYGKPVFVRFARVGIQDHVGTEMHARATVILLGERPGLGTGDSLSAYIAYEPKMDQDNAEKNCISNIRQLGFKPHEAAIEIVKVIQRAIAAGKGGVAAL